MSLVIRAATPDDAAGLAEVAAATFPLACPPHTTDEAQATFIAEILSERRFAEYLADPDRALFVAHQQDGPMVGYTMLVFTEPTDPDVLAAIRAHPSVELSKCYVRDGHHGAGVAAQLMNASLERARAHGAVGVWLGVNEENARAQRFYAKHGFERVGTKRFLVGDRFEDDYVMELGLRTRGSDTPIASDYELVLRAESVVTAAGIGPAAVGVSGGVIRAIEPFDSAMRGRAEHTLAADRVLIPGIVDTHVHVNEPGRTAWEGFASATLAAAAGGVTTIIDMPLNSIPPTTTVEALELKRAAAARQASVDIGFWGGAIPRNLGSLRLLHEAGVFGFKAFLSPSGVDEFPALSTEELFLAAGEIAAFGGLLIVHAEDPAVLERHSNAGGIDYRDFVASRPESAEGVAIATVIEAVRRTGVRAHILHLSSALAIDALRAAKSEGLPITVETCPHYLSFAAEDIPSGATQFKCCPPIRDEANRDALWRALEEGVIDFIASDHSPATRELKLGHGGDFGAAWGGISGLQLSLSAVWSGARARGIPLDRVVKWMSAATAEFAGLSTKGRIEVGAAADLVAFAPETSFRVDAGTLLHKNPVSAFDGSSLYGHVETTWLRGTMIYSADAAPAAQLTGELLRSLPLSAE